MWEQMLSLPLYFPTKAFQILDVRSLCHPPLSSCSPLSVQLYGDAIRRPGPWSHHEEAAINRPHHCVPLLPASKRTQGEFVSIILDFDMVQHRIDATPSGKSVTPLCIWSRRTMTSKPPRLLVKAKSNLKVTHDLKAAETETMGGPSH